MKFPKRLNKKLEQRLADNAFRRLPSAAEGIDFCSNDYLGLSRDPKLKEFIGEILEGYDFGEGSTGSRLISGNHKLYKEAEDMLTTWYASESALIFNSGYDANIGFFSSVPQRGDIVFYDEYIHASIRDGLSMGNAGSFKFRHNDLEHLESLLKKYLVDDNECYVVTESVFSMDGDSPDLDRLINLCKAYDVNLVVDEAHAVGVVGEKGKGLTFSQGRRESVFARIVTFGKGPGVHGAAVLGSQKLKDYLVNFCRSLIYTTALPPHSVAGIMASHRLMIDDGRRDQLWDRIRCFQNKLNTTEVLMEFKGGDSAIATIVIPGNENVKEVAKLLNDEGFRVKPIVSPTVPKGKERLRICLHSYNSFEEIESLFDRLLIFVKPYLLDV
ncbi:aminotransferase class I/II-fold pyridoxal phosphate-dependent enzyme [Robertkochia marina]|nr:8-amino-7-oxononanoate synthase [Robertkochia marina]